MADEHRGVYRKYNVTRTDGSSGPDGKHEKCSYWVLDLEHDEYARPALEAYAKACAGKSPKLAADIRDALATRPCGCRAVGECFHWGPQTLSEAVEAKMERAGD